MYQRVLVEEAVTSFIEFSAYQPCVESVSGCNRVQLLGDLTVCRK
jgi:hypothetical protein